jgi:intracellular septation protein
MQLLFDFLPIVLFFTAYVVTKDLLVAVAVLMVVAPLAFAVQWFISRKINKISAASTLLVVILGGATLISGDSVFIFWKPTVLYWAVAIAFLTSQFIGDKPFIRRMMEAASKDSDASVQLSRQKWVKLNLMWVVFFVFAGGLNIYVAYNYAEETWVNFKLFGLLGLTFVFIIAQSLWLAQNIKQDVS